MRRISPLILFLLMTIFIIALVSLGPSEKALGANVRLVYLHGAWVWTALIGFAAAAVFGIAGLVLKREQVSRHGIALGQAATLFWVSYLPLSIWTMQANWGGLFLEEPRWRMALDFAIVAVLIQISILIMKNSRVGSMLNTIYFLILILRLSQTEQVMHPPSPILSSDSLIIRAFFFILLFCCLLAGYLLSRWLDKKASIQ